MTCREFLNLWNDRLDGHAGVDEAALERHANDCAACARLAVGFLAIESQDLQGVVPDGMTERILTAWALERPRGTYARWSSALLWSGIGSAAAAAVLLLLFAPWREPVRRHPVATNLRVAKVRPWTSALADATSATIALARETSAPAARLGQEVLVAAGKDELALSVSLPTPSPPAEWLPAVTKSVRSGVQPIPGSARRAFSFLSAPKPANRPSPAPVDSGA